MHNRNGHARRQGGAQPPPPSAWAEGRLVAGPLSGLIERTYREDIDKGLRVMDEALKAAAETAGQQQ
ncbi:MAG: hypothetical protein H8E45_04780 [Proteobacteria bacterium]|nr:hypothetical protein [Pseudomonadota bacterium]